MSTTQDTTVDRRVGADGDAVDNAKPTDEVVTASIPGDDESKFVVIVLSNPLNEKDRVYLGLPADASTEVGQKVKVNRNGAKAIIDAGYACIDPEDHDAVRSALQPEDAEAKDAGEPTATPSAEAPTNALSAPPQARSTPTTPPPAPKKPGEGV